MVKRLTKEYTEYMKRVERIEEALVSAIPAGSIKVEVLKALHNVTLDLLNEYMTGIYKVYEDE